MTSAERKKQADKVFYTALTANSILMALKFAAGILGNSGAMISDAIHTLSDVGTTVIAIFGVRIAAKDSDKEHPYGHERIESVVGLVLAFILAVTAFMVGKSGIEQLLAGKRTFVAPEPIALVAAVVSVATQEALYRLANSVGRKIESTAMIADSWHHRSDALSSIGSFIGIGAAELGYWFMEPVASLIICIFIFKVAWSIGKEAIDQLIDVAAPPEEEECILAAIRNMPGVMHVDRLRSRRYGSHLYVDAEIAVWHEESFEQAHQVCESVHNMLERDFPKILNCTVHANPHHHDGSEVEDTESAGLALPAEEEERIRNAVRSVDGVLHIDSLQLRRYADKLYTDMEIAVLCDASFEQAHAICERVHSAVEGAFPEMEHCAVHANPHNSDGTEVAEA